MSGDPAVADSESVLGACLAEAHRFSEAESLLVASYSVLNAKRGQGSRATQATLERIVVLYRAWGKAGKAREYEALMESSRNALAPR